MSDMYNKALEQAKKELEVCGSIYCDAAKQIFRLFPMLKKSANEKIKKAIFEGLKHLEKNLGWDSIEGVNISDAYEWLSEQSDELFNDTDEDIVKAAKDISTLDLIESKFHEGDFIKYNKANLICQVISVNSGSCYVENIETSGRIELFNAEQNFHLWTLEDAKDGDILVTKYDQPFIYNGRLNESYIGAYVGLDCLGDSLVISSKKCQWSSKDGVKPATPYQRSILFNHINEAGYMWNFEKKVLSSEL